MFKKRISALVAGATIAASSVIAPSAFAQTDGAEATAEINYCDYDNDHPGVSSVEAWLEGAPEEANTDCIDVGDINKECGFVQIPITDRVIGYTTTPPMNYWIEYTEVDTGVTDAQVMPEEGVSFPEGYNGGSVTIQAYIGGPEQDYVAFANEDEWKYPGQQITIDTNCPVKPGLPGGGSAGLGSAALGLSALAGSALLSSGGSSAIPDGDGSGPGSADLSSGSSDQDNGNGGDNGAGTGNGGDDSEGPAQGPVDSPDSKATGQQPATGPVGGQDPKAVAQAQAANAPAAAPAKAAPAAQQAAPAPAAQQQLANTGVQGTLIALAAGLAAIAAGALLVLRRRA